MLSVTFFWTRWDRPYQIPAKTSPNFGLCTVLSTGFMVKPSRSKLREISWTKLDYLTRDASHQSNQIEILKGMAHEHFVSLRLTHIVNCPVLQQCGGIKSCWYRPTSHEWKTPTMYKSPRCKQSSAAAWFLLIWFLFDPTILQVVESKPQCLGHSTRPFDADV